MRIIMIHLIRSLNSKQNYHMSSSFFSFVFAYSFFFSRCTRASLKWIMFIRIHSYIFYGVFEFIINVFLNILTVWLIKIQLPLKVFVCMCVRAVNGWYLVLSHSTTIIISVSHCSLAMREKKRKRNHVLKYYVISFDISV